MSKKKPSSRALRSLAEEFIRQATGDELPATEHAELATSLVRQWITCADKAILFLKGQQFNVVLGKTPLGKSRVLSQRDPFWAAWLKRVVEQWKVSPEDLPDILDQLNRGQSAEVTNDAGEDLRLWVNPGDGSRGIEPLVKKPLPAEWKRDHRTIAADILEQQLGALVDATEKEQLTDSVVRQWQKYQGHASLFVGADVLHITFTEVGDGHCNVAVKRVAARIGPMLCSCGLAPEVVPEVIARLNLDQEMAFQDKRGVRSRLWHDPRARQICVRPVDAAASVQARPALPLFCPKCNAVLRFWREGEQQQVCPCCGQVVTLSGF